MLQVDNCSVGQIALHGYGTWIELARARGPDLAATLGDAAAVYNMLENHQDSTYTSKGGQHMISTSDSASDPAQPAS
jgi:hypothetical protein